MSSNNDDSSCAKTSNNDLLNELESIKGLLDKERDVEISMLDDVVDNPAQIQAASQAGLAAAAEKNNSDLLDLIRIFDDSEVSIVNRLNRKDLNTNPTILDFKLDTSATDNADIELIDDQPLSAYSEPQTIPLSPEDPDYEEEQEEMFAEHEMAPSCSSVDSSLIDNDFNIDLLIEEIIDEFIPAIEDKLRQRLSQCYPAAINQLAEKLRKD